MSNPRHSRSFSCLLHRFKHPRDKGYTLMIVYEWCRTCLEQCKHFINGDENEKSAVLWQTVIPNCAIIAVQLIFSANSLIVKAALEGKSLPPLLFLCMRVMISVCCMFVVAYVQNSYKFPHVAREWHPKLMMLSLFGVVGNQVFHIYGLDLTSPTVQAIFQPSMAIWTMAICVALKLEHINGLKIFGLAAAIAGAVVVILYPAPGSFDNFDGYDVNKEGFANEEEASYYFVLGVFFLIGNTMSYAIYLVQQKPLLNIIPPTTIAFYTFFYGAIVESILAARYIVSVDYRDFDVYVWLAVLYAGFFTSGLGYFLSLWAMKRTNPPLVSLASTIQPIAAAVLSYIFRDEEITLPQLFGGLLILIGLGCTVYAQSYHKVPEIFDESSSDLYAHNLEKGILLTEPTSGMKDR